MSLNIVIAYSGLGEAQVEHEVLQTLGADIHQFSGLDTPEAQAAVRQADALMVTIQKVSAELIESMEHCRVISRAGTGFDAIDVQAATEKGIWVAYVPDYSIDEVSSHTIALLLAHARGIPDLVASTRTGGWSHKVAAPRRRLRGQTLGLAGFGRIGQVVAAKARALGLEIIVHDPYLGEQGILDGGARPVDRETLLRESDYLSLHAPLTDGTRDFLNAEALSLMKPTAFVINAARGGLVDEDALLHAVQSGQIAGAALDVLKVEPPAPDSPLLHDPRIMITPHSAWYSEDAGRDVRVRASEEVIRVLRGERPRCPVNEVGGKGRAP